MSLTKVELYTVIQSMTPNQKRVFRMQCQLGKPSSNALVLFDTFNRLDEYDKDKITKYLRKINKGKLEKNLSTEMGLLSKMLLKSLRNNKKTIEKKLWNTFEDLKLFNDLGFFEKSQRKLQELKNDAHKHNVVLLLHEIYEFEFWNDIFLDRNIDPEIAKENYKKEMGLTNVKKLEIDLRYTYRKVFYLVQNISTMKKSEAKTRLTEIETTLNKIDEKQCTSFKMKMLYLHAMAKIERLKANKEAALKYMEEMYQEYLADKGNSKASNLQDVKFLANYLNYIVIYNEPYDQFMEVLVEIKNIEMRTEQEAITQFSDVYHIEFRHYLNQADFEKMENAIPSLLEGLKKYGDKMDLGRKVTMWYNLMIYSFLIKDFDSIDFWIEKILKYGKKSRRVDFFHNSKIFDLLVHYELGEIAKSGSTVFLESVAEKVKNSFTAAKKSNELVNLVTKLMKTRCKKTRLEKKDFETALQQFHQIDQSKNKEALPYDEIEIWLRSKIQELPMQKITKQVLQKKINF